MVRSRPQLKITGASQRVKINVGGRVFETTLDTLQVAGEDSNLVKIVSENPEPFFDRDPEPFAILLSLLRTGKIDDEYSEALPLNKLIREATYYGLVEQLQTALAPDPLAGVTVEKRKNLTWSSVPNGRPSSLAPGSDGSVWVGHGNRITVYDWSLRKGMSTIAELPTVEILDRISDTQVAAGAPHFPGFHIYNVMEGTHTKSLRWQEGMQDGVGAITSNDTQIFMSSGSIRSQRGSQGWDTTLHYRLFLVDKTTVEIQREICTQSDTIEDEGFDDFSDGERQDCMKLQWLPQKNLLLEGRSFGSDSVPYIRLWDVRSERNVWQWTGHPRKDGFADIVASEELSGILKASTTSGSIAMFDMRNLTAKDPWFTLTGSAVKSGISPRRLQTHNRQLYASDGSTLEIWSEVPLAKRFKALSDKKYTETSFERNFLDYCQTPTTDSNISNLAIGGNRLFVSRASHVEVWESRRGL